VPALKPLTSDRGHDNVLLGQDHRTPRGGLRGNGGMVNSRAKAKEIGGKLALLHFCFVHHECYFKSPGTEPGSLRLEASV
jgi:hypothetical protein